MEHTPYCSTEITELARAMLKVQADLQPALKDRENTFSHSRYATLNSVMDACREALIGNGIWLALMVMPLPKADPQGYGSALTYGRRYGLSALLGIVTEEDDDGIAAGTDSAGQAKRKRQTRQQETPIATGNKPTTEAKPQNQSEEHILLATMPRLDGIIYSLTTTQDGKTCIVASGNTANKKHILSQAGFKYSEQRKIWWRYAEVA